MSTDKWADYWENESATGECFVNKDGQKNPELMSFWQTEFKAFDSNPLILDVASGGGSIFSSLSEPKNHNFYASDLSFQALKKQNIRNDKVNLVVSEANTRVFAQRSFDLVVSQFGIEYAPKEAFSVSNEILKPGGKMICLCHIKDGYIDSKNCVEKEGVKLTASLRFIEMAIAITEAMFQGNEQLISANMAAFRRIEPKMAEFAQLHQSGLQFHLYYGFRKMMESIKNYKCSDIIQWLNQMNIEIQKIEPRLDEMMKAAQTRQDVADIARILISSGSENIETTPFYLSQYEKPIAWKIIATKQK